MSDSLIPAEDWVTDPEPYPSHDQACPTCSALVENRVIHRAWHLAIFDLAAAYVPPPTGV